MNRFFLSIVAASSFAYVFGNTASDDAFTLFLRQNIGKGIGYDSGYTTISGVVTPFSSGKRSSFIDIRGHHFNRSSYAANAGMGFRTSFDSICSLFGVNAYYDYRGSHNHPFHQIGLGFEMLGERWQISLNGYLPIAKTQRTICNCLFNDYAGDFFIRKRKLERSLKGIDLQAKGKIAQAQEFSFYLLGGPYYYDGICKNFLGIKGAVVGQWKQIFRLAFNMSYDPVFKTRVQGEIAFTYSFGGRIKRENNCLPSNSDFIQSIQRNEIIVLDQFCRWKWNF